MNKQEIYWLRGLPASGKSTFAKEWVNQNPTNRTRINKDDLRSLLHNNKFSKGNEKQILKIQEDIILSTLKEGKSIVIDNTHLVEKHLENLKQLLFKNGFNNIPVIIKDFTNVSPEECIQRDLIRPNSVGSNVIWRMYWDHIANIQELSYSASKKDAIIVDIDGTLAEMFNRGPFNWSKVGQDKVRKHIRNLVNIYARAGYEIILVSGRDFCCYTETVDWLIENEILFNALYMRSINDNRKDFIVKKEIYHNAIEPNYNIFLVVDDRPQVIRQWRLLGLPVINANPCDKEF